mgnify:CR=1 FL=1
MQKRKAVVLLSGGIDSATCCAIAKKEGFQVSALTFEYGQKHLIEVQRAQALGKALGVEQHVVMKLDLASLEGSALTGAGKIPHGREDPTKCGIPPTYVPARNTIFLALALAFAEAKGMEAIYVGVNCVDFSGYPDCSPEFLEAFRQVAKVGTKAGVEGRAPQIKAPLLYLTKAEIIRRAYELGVDLCLTHSCSDPDPAGRACGTCDSCILRKKGFEEAGLPDPTVYAEKANS